MMKNAGQWQIVVMHNMDLVPPKATNYMRKQYSFEDEVGIFRMSFEISGHIGADHIDFDPMPAGPLEG